ncbi:MAG: thiamine phosphate synthase [Alphaproteobacteria bacterium]|nr:thiamine phosphate synthase [Alphaproteobacteria bacterium]
MTIASAARSLKRRATRRFPGAARLPALLLLTDAERLADPVPVLARLPRGSGVILRDYAPDTPDAVRAASALRVRRACRGRGLRLIVAGDARLALRIGADGLHLPEWMLMRSGIGARQAMRGAFRRPGFIVTAACHSLGALRAAARLGADAAVLGPAFATPSHPASPALGAVRFARLVRAAGIPVYALGGIGARTARRLAGSGATGIAGIGFATEGIGGPAAGLDHKKIVV